MAGAEDKVHAELDELKEEVTKKNKSEMEMEFGDLLFSLINYARFLKINPETALELTNKKFINRFKYIESQAFKLGKKINQLSLEEMNFFWQQAKSN